MPPNISININFELLAIEHIKVVSSPIRLIFRVFVKCFLLKTIADKGKLFLYRFDKFLKLGKYFFCRPIIIKIIIFICNLIKDNVFRTNKTYRLIFI